MRLLPGAMPAPGTFVPKVELADGCYYEGACRNASIARWHAASGLFYHWRHKFGHRFVETLRCPEDEARWDVFVATRIRAFPTEEIPVPAADARMDLDTRCAACRAYRYGDVNDQGIWRDGRWWCGELCFKRLNKCSTLTT